MGARVLYVSEGVGNVKTELSHLVSNTRRIGKGQACQKANGWRLMFEEQPCSASSGLELTVSHSRGNLAMSGTILPDAGNEGVPHVGPDDSR